jgi:hypothetical protein
LCTKCTAFIWKISIFSLILQAKIIKTNNNMNRLLLIIFTCLFLDGNVWAGIKVRVEMQPNSYENPTKHGRPWERELTWTPQVFLEDKELSFELSNSPTIIYVYRGDRMVYSQMASEGSANVVFPDGLKGEFTLYMFYGDTEFCGVINL